MFIRLSPFEERSKEGLTADVIMADAAEEDRRRPTSRRLTWRCSARRQWTGWAPWAGSNCRWRTAPISVTRRCRRRPSNCSAPPWPRPTRSRSALSTFRAGVPQVYLDVDRAKAESMHVPLDAIWDTLSIYLGSLYVNDFTFYGRPYHVTAQADAPFRAKPERREEPQDAQCQRRNGAVGHAGEGEGHQRARAGGPLQHVSHRRNHRQHRARASAPARPSSSWRTWPRRSCRAA